MITAENVKERPILFSAPMVRAILEGRKTQTRRIVKPQPEIDEKYGGFHWPSNLAKSMVEVRDMGCLGPYGSRGDRLWVKETFSLMNRDRTEAWTRKVQDRPADAEVVYRADEDHGHKAWRPSIFMPRWASRITLEVTSVRVERLQDITAEDAIAEGIDATGHRCDCDVCVRTSGYCTASASSLVLAYAELWREINGAESWIANPFVWVVSFRRVEAQERAA